MPVVAEMLSLTTELHSRTFNRTAGFAIASQNANDAVDVMHRSKRLLQLGINYRWSSIVLEERQNLAGYPIKSSYGIIGDKPRAGDRAPEVSSLTDISLGSDGGPTKTLFEIFAEGLHSILAFGGSGIENISECLATFSRYSASGVAKIVVVCPRQSTILPSGDLEIQVLVDTGGQGFSGYAVDVDTNTFVVVRPDGFIGTYTSTEAGVHRYFRGVLQSDLL